MDQHQFDLLKPASVEPVRPEMVSPNQSQYLDSVGEPATVTTALEVKGMRCAGCVQSVEKRLRQQTGVVTAAVNLVTEMAMVDYQPAIVQPQDLAATLTQYGFPSQIPTDRNQVDADARIEQQRQQVFQQIYKIAIAGLLILLSGLGHLDQIGNGIIPDFYGLSFHSLSFHCGLATLALLGPGREILVDGWRGMRQGTPNMNTLVGLGTVSAYSASLVAFLWPSLSWECFFDEPVMIVGFILLGRALEQQARNRASASFRALLDLQPAIARWLPTQNGQKSIEIPVQQVRVGTWLQVLPGDKFPVDGNVLTGQTLVDESMLTGEATPVHKSPGDKVIGGTLNQSGVVTITATHTGKATALAQIIALVEAAQTRKAPIQRLVDQVAGYFTYGVIAVAVLTFLFWYGFGSHWIELPALTDSPHHHALVQTQISVPMGETAPLYSPLLLSLKLAIAVLVVACPCALGLATPTAILVGTSLGAERGLLIRGGDVLERMHKLDTVVFDKTGTLTTGKPTVQKVWLSDASSLKLSADQLLQVAASVESGILHPFAQAIVQAAQAKDLPLLPATDCLAMAGLGVGGQVEGQAVYLGTADWLRQQGISLTAQNLMLKQELAHVGNSLIYIAIAGQFVGGMAIADPLRDDALQTVTGLRAMGLRVMVLTGDQPETAAAVLQPLGLADTEIRANVRPVEKAAILSELQAQGQSVAMVGDGINDAPALAQADVGIALSSGTDVAVETAQIVLMRGSLTQGGERLVDVLEAIHLSRQTFKKIQQNLFWACGYNLIGIPLAAGVLLPKFGVTLSPAAAGAMMAFSSVCVVTNSLLLRRVQWVGDR
jgi:P-type Cu2+ transporter